MRGLGGKIKLAQKVLRVLEAERGLSLNRLLSFRVVRGRGSGRWVQVLPSEKRIEHRLEGA